MSPDADARRRPMLAKVHIARKELALDEGAYRAVVARVTGRDSAGACSAVQLDRLLAEFRRLGWKPKDRSTAKPLVRKVHAIWNDMAPMLADPSPAALRAFVRRQTRSRLHPDGVAAPEFLEDDDAHKVIEGLKGWRDRLENAGGPNA